MNTLGTLRALRRAQKRGDEIGAVALLQGLGGEWRPSFTSYGGGIATVRWNPPEGSVYAEALEGGTRTYYLATASTVEKAFAAVLVEVSIAVFRLRVTPLAQWLARVAAAAVLGV